MIKLFSLQDYEGMTEQEVELYSDDNFKFVGFETIEELLALEKSPDIFLLDVGAINEHRKLIELCKKFPKAQIWLRSGAGVFVSRFLDEMKALGFRKKMKVIPMEHGWLGFEINKLKEGDNKNEKV